MPVLSRSQDARVKQLRRAYQRQLKRRPTMIERTAMERAARLTSRAEAAAVDPNVPADLVVRLDNAAARARSKLGDLIGHPSRREPVARRPSVPASDAIAAFLAEQVGEDA